VSLVIPPGLDLYMPVPETNPITPEKVELGRRLFRDRRLSRDGTIACSSCHKRELAFSDGRANSVGVFGRTGRRNAPTIVNRGYGRAFFWDARMTSLEEQVLEPIQDPNEMDMTLDEAAKRVNLDSTTIARALASYVRSIVTGGSPFDRYINGDRNALSADERRGMQIFRGKGNCTACHVGPTLSDEKLHNTGVAWKAAPAGSPQTGGLTDSGAGQGNFKTPTLREVARTAPYMHDGSLATLEAVVTFYSDGGRPNPSLDPEIHPLRLSVDEKRSLVAFLKSLSGTIHEGRVTGGSFLRRLRLPHG